MIYSGFISRRNAMRDAFASINVQLKKRWDLEAVEAFAGHERGVLEAVIAARNARSGSAQWFRREEEVAAEIHQLFVLAENFSELGLSEEFLMLQSNLTEVEGQIGASTSLQLCGDRFE